MLIDFSLTKEAPYEVLVAMQVLSQQLAASKYQQNNDALKDETVDEVEGPADV